MEYKGIVTWDSVFIVGMDFYGDPFSKASSWSKDNEISTLWTRFMELYSKSSDYIKCKNQEGVFLEVHFVTDETMTKGYSEVFVGVIVDRIEDIPLSCVAKQLPSTRYAVFTLKGREITTDWWRYIFEEWLSDSGYEVSYNFSIQYCDKRFKGMDRIDESEMDVYVPVK